MTVKIKDVAEYAGVSTATVSRVLNNHPNVSESTRKKVFKAIKRLNYIPNQGGRNLRKQKSNTILVLIPDIRNYFYNNILYGMDNVLTRYGYNLIIGSTNSEITREKNLVTLVYQKLVDGIIFLASTLTGQELSELNELFPIIQCCEFYENGEITHISIDNYKAAYDVTEYLIHKGHKRIAFISSQNNFLSTRLRESGYIQALKDYSLEYDENLMIRGDYSFQSGYLSTNILMSLSNPPTAIFAISDVVAAGAIQALYQLGKNVPGDVAVFGFDDIDLAKQLTPPLSTVAQPLESIGSLAAKTMLDKLAGKKAPNEIILPYELMLRSSS